MRRRGEGLNGRGHCAKCFTPTLCARPLKSDNPCGCHTPKGEKCGTCPAGLYIVLPPDSRIEEIAAWLKLDDHTKDTLAAAAWQARLKERRTA